MSAKTFSDELIHEHEHLIDRLIDKVESLGLDGSSPEVHDAIESWFGPEVADVVADYA